MEHRCGHRRSAQLPVLIRSSVGPTHRGHVCDISASGALVMSAWATDVHRPLLLHFLKGRFTEYDCAVRAAVVRLVDNGFAVEWEDFSPPPIRSILRQIAQANVLPTPGHPLTTDAQY